MDNGSIDLVLVDFDDTLVATAGRFRDARLALFALLAGCGLDEQAVARLHSQEIDPEMRERYGFGPHRLAHAFSETYRRACERWGGDIDAAILEQCEALGNAVAGAPPPLEGALAALERLARTHPTVVYTQSARMEYQLGCVRETGVLEIIGGDHRVRVCSEKTTDEFHVTLDHFGIREPAGTWMVGNSMRSDINPALAAGANAILVEIDEPWEFDVVEPIAQGFHRVRTFPEAVDMLVEPGRTKAPGGGRRSG